MSLGSDYESAVRSGNTPLANYLAQMLAANAGINIAANQVEAAPASFFSSNSAPSAGGDSGGFWGGLGKFPLLPVLPGLTPDNIGSVIKGAGDVAKGLSGAASGASSAIKFITDIPRVATTLLGLILVIAGIFALTRGPTVNIVTRAVTGAVTS